MYQIRAFSLSLMLWLVASPGWAGAPAPQRQGELLNLLRHDCGSCHGLTLRGGLGPALLPDALRGKPDEYLLATILYGRPGTAMPPWGPFLSVEEASWLVARMRGGLL